MTIKLANYRRKANHAVKAFWKSRDNARLRQNAKDRIDQGERAGVTGGKNMDGFINLVKELVEVNGLINAEIHQNKAVLALPGYFRPTKLWDLLITYKGELVAAIEFKSQVGPSFGNNFNNRAEEAIGTAHDFWVAYREEAFGQQPRPFVGWLILVEDVAKSRIPIKAVSPHFPILKEFEKASYLERYDQLCKKLIKEQLYTTASLIAAKRDSISSGRFSDLSNMTSLKTFVTTFGGHIAATAARFGNR